MSLDIDAVAEIASKHPHIPGWALPSPSRYAQWVDWVMWDDGCDDGGNLLGWCPMHDADKAREGSAEFNFLKGIMRCQGDPSCHPKRRAISLTNAYFPIEGEDAKRG